MTRTLAEYEAETDERRMDAFRRWWTDNAPTIDDLDLA